MPSASSWCDSSTYCIEPMATLELATHLSLRKQGRDEDQVRSAAHQVGLDEREVGAGLRDGEHRVQLVGQQGAGIAIAARVR